MSILGDKDITELHEFIVNNPELEILEAKLDEFNPFTVINDRREVLRRFDDPFSKEGLVGGNGSFRT